jgi:hypothetical protein
MKKIFSTLLACVLAVGCIFSLASCVLAVGPITMISGAYEADIAIAEVEYEFSPLGKVVLTVDPILGDDKVYEGKYKVEDGEITLTFEDDDAAIYEGTFDFSEGEEDGKQYIKMGIVKYTLED